MASWARWCFRHRWSVLAMWLVVLIGTVGAGAAVGSAHVNVLELPGTGSTKAYDRMADAFPELSGDEDAVVWKVERGTVHDPAVRDRVTAALADMARMPDVGEVASPYDAANASQISADGRIAYARVTFVKQAYSLDIENTRHMIDRAHEARTDGLRVEMGGEAIGEAQQPPTGLAEAVAVLAAGVILFFAFGSFFAMLLPLLSGVVAVGTGLSCIALLSHATEIPDIATLLASLIGLGVAIDYALFIVTRHRQGLRNGLTAEEATVRALDTSGRAVLFAGGTVCVALLALFSVDITFLNGIAVSTTLVVLISMLSAVTLLPAMLGLLGARTLNRRERRAMAAGGDAQHSQAAAGSARGTTRWAGWVERHPRTLGGAALVLMAALAVPVLSIRLGTNDQGNQPASQTVRQAYDLLAEGFGPGFNGPLLMVAEVDDTRAGQAADSMLAQVRATAGVVRADELPLPTDASELAATTRVFRVIPATSPQSEATDRLIDRLRDDIVPAAEAGTTLDVHIGGPTALQKDFATVVGDRLPVFVLLIVGLGALLMFVAFRSIAIPLTSAAMNLLAAAASFGLLVLIFQWGWGMDLFGLGKEGPIISFLPVIMLPLLFGLSMDYQVFLVSRMHEEWTHTADNARAVRVGLASTGRVINSAALIMICVFFSFVLSGDRGAMMAGVGLAGAVALDAFLLRMILVPAVMHLLGRANWWLPRWLDKRMPHIAVEATDIPPAREPAPAAAAAAR